MSTIFPSLEKVQGRTRRWSMNMTDNERLASATAGVSLIAAALFRSGVARGILLGSGTALLLRAATGRCPLYHELGIDRRDLRQRPGVPGNDGLRIEHSVDVRCPARALYQFWRRLEQLPRILRHVESVEPTDEWHSHWVARGPLGPALEWEAEIVNDRENELIAWQSIHGASLRNAGSVRFAPTYEGLTRVKVCLELQPIGGPAAIALGRIFGTDPQRELEDDLERFQDFAERELSPASHSLY